MVRKEYLIQPTVIFTKKGVYKLLEANKNNFKTLIIINPNETTSFLIEEIDNYFKGISTLTKEQKILKIRDYLHSFSFKEPNHTFYVLRFNNISYNIGTYNKTLDSTYKKQKAFIIPKSEPLLDLITYLKTLILNEN